MYYFVKNKLYIQDGDKLVGVNIDADQNVTHVKGTETSIGNEIEFIPLTHFEVQCKFGLLKGLEYKFPLEVKVDPEVDLKVGEENEPVGKVKATTKRTRK